MGRTGRAEGQRAAEQLLAVLRRLVARGTGVSLPDDLCRPEALPDRRDRFALPAAVRRWAGNRLRADGPAPSDAVRRVLNRVLNHVAAAVERGEMTGPLRYGRPQR